MISNISIWEELLLEMERPGRMLKWIYVPGHAGLEGNDTAHILAVEGMCFSTLWALPHTAFSRQTEDTQTAHEPALCPAAAPAPGNHICGARNHYDWGGGQHRQLTKRSPGAIWLSLGLVEMSEPEEGSHEATTTSLPQCDTSSSDDSKPYGWTKGTDHSTDVGDTRKHHKKRRTNPPRLAPQLGKGGRPSLAQASLSRASLGRDP